MTSAFHDAIAGAQAAINAFAGESVSYSRGETSAVLTAVYSPKEYPVISEYDVAESVQMDDWLIVAADLVLGGSAVKPARGDVIRKTVGATVYKYEVQPLSGKNVFEWSGSRQRYRVHAKFVGTEAAT